MLMKLTPERDKQTEREWEIESDIKTKREADKGRDREIEIERDTYRKRESEIKIEA